jgi:hypothetical protein
MLTREEALELLRQELVIDSSIEDLRLFVDSSVWRDMSTSINTSIEALRDELELPGTDGTEEVRLANYAYLQGQLAAFRILIDLPKLLLITKESEIREIEDERNS